jgi:hypothetical protein
MSMDTPETISIIITDRGSTRIVSLASTPLVAA